MHSGKMRVCFNSEHARKIYDSGSLLTYQTDGSSGVDLRAVSITEYDHVQQKILTQKVLSSSLLVDGDDCIDRYVLKSGCRVMVGGGICCAVEKGLEIQVRSRSGLSWKYGVMVINSPGTIDSDYRGEIGAILTNTSHVDYEILPGDRVAQLVIAPVVIVDMEFVEELDHTDRGVSGFGSTGKR